MPKQWENHRAEIESLYCTQNKPLHEVASYMLNKHGFAASTRSYRTHIREWGLKRRYKSRSNHRKGSATSTSSVETTASSIDDNSDGDPSSGDETIQQPKHEPRADSVMFNLQAERNLEMLAQLKTDLRLDPMPPDLSASPTSALPAPGDIGAAVFSTFAPLVERVMNRNSPLGISENWEESSPLSRAIRLGFDDLVALLLSYGADPNARVGCYGRTALHQAVFYGRLGTVQTVLDHGAAVSVPDAAALSPLHQAVNKLKTSASMADVVRLLVARDADVNAQDGFARTPFAHLLLIPRDTHFRFPCALYVELVYLFLQKGAAAATSIAPNASPQQPQPQPQQQDRSAAFKTFLDALVRYAAASAGEPWPCEASPLRQAVTLFLRRGADPDTPAETGDTLLSFLLRQPALSDQMASVVRLLCVHADAKERALRNDHVLRDQRQILSLVASSAFWSQGLDGQLGGGGGPREHALGRPIKAS